jgi:prevent-host-death family protein
VVVSAGVDDVGLRVDNYLQEVDMSNTISVGELRQNPTRMLREVKSGATYTITDHGEPVAEIVPRHEPRWVRSEDLDALLRDLGSDVAWAQEIADDRAAIDTVDPWEAGK